MAMPVVTVATGGLPVVDVTATTGRGMPVSEAANARGTAVTKVTSGGMGVVYSTVADFPGQPGGGGGGPAAAFLARTSGLDTTHTNAYTALINGLVTDSLWSKFDALYIFATQNTATAQLNLVSSSYPATPNGSPTFTADQGYTGTTGSSTVYIDTGFNSATASSPKFVQDSAHLSMWNLTNVADANAACGVTVGGIWSVIWPKYTDNSIYAPLNMSGLGTPLGVADPRGHHHSNRSGASTHNLYRNGSSVVSDSNASSPVPNANIRCLGSGGGSGNAHQHAMLSFGSSLSSTDVTNFYNRLRTYMTAVGVP